MNDIEDITERIQELTKEIQNNMRIRDKYMQKAVKYADRAKELAEAMHNDILILEAYMATQGVDIDE